ncbi:histidine--tRNA ligase [Candidatus Dojkabacteria bacterium]|nr:histidine--tRNA ligase [Candidatus Dojkabacteria bacterium]
MNTLSVNPPKGTYDWDPKEFAIRKYIFDTWRKVCKSFGYEEYLTPVLEDANIYRAKSGEEVGGKELMIVTDRAGRELAMRPEMTPSVTRLVAKTYESMQKPVRYFSIANFFRNQKPQRGRNREFWQLNYDIFGADSLSADVEIIQIAIEIMLALGAPKDSFKVRINNRKLIDYVLSAVPSANRQNVVRLMDKVANISREDLVSALKELNVPNVDALVDFVSGDIKNLPDCEGTTELNTVYKVLSELGFAEYVKIDTSIVRGFDYYDGTVFEVFDENPENKRSLFGGGRYNGLAVLFGKNSFPAVGCAPGDETTKLFLEGWNLVPEYDNSLDYLVTRFKETKELSDKIAAKLRKEGCTVVSYLDADSLDKQLRFADKIGAKNVVIIGEDEAKNGVYLVKDMITKTQKQIRLT